MLSPAEHLGAQIHPYHPAMVSPSRLHRHASGTGAKVQNRGVRSGLQVRNQVAPPTLVLKKGKKVRHPIILCRDPIEELPGLIAYGGSKYYIW